MAKQIIFWDQAREKMLSWMKIVADTVSVTMGPKWRNVILDKGFWAPQVTNDWVTIAKEIEVEWKFENMWAELVKDAADRTNSEAWDGTTTSTVLTYAIAKEGLRYIKSWVNAVELKNWLKEASDKVVEELKKNSKKISSKEEIAQVATISAQDKEVWNIIAEAMEKVGNNWVISVKEWQTFGIEVEVTEGMEFDEGYLSPYMVSNTEKMTAEINEAPIIITDQKISNMKDILPLLEQLVNSWKKDLVIIADDVEGEALTAIILNKLKGALNVLAVKAPGFGDNKKEMLHDIAVLTWANVIEKDLWMKLENVTLEDLGQADSVVSTKDKTTIIGGKGDKEEINKRVEAIKKAIENTDSSYDKEKLQERLAKLDWGVAVIKVWAASEVEVKEKKLRIEDALNATRAAVEEWVVAWGWVALLKASKVLENLDLWNEDKNIAVSILKHALRYPISKIASNAWKEASVIASEVEKNEDVNYWYDASSDKYVNMMESWIIDPTKVERVALQEAVSLSGMFLTTEAAITDLPKKDNDQWCADGSCWVPPMGWMGWMPMM